MDNYILDDQGEAVLETNLTRWAQWFEAAERHVAEDTVGDVRVSTVFLGMNHSFSGGPPVLYETMIFGGVNDQYQDRYTSKADAIQGHARALQAVKDGTKLD